MKLFHYYTKVIMFASICGACMTSCEKAIEYNTADIPAFIGLPAPKQNEGHQIHIEPFPVPANFEREFYIRLPIGNKEKIYVTGFEAKMRTGTHHLIAYPFTDEKATTNPPIGVIRDQNLISGNLNIRSNLNMNGFVLESTAPEYRIDIPNGYAIPFEADATLDFNSHYFNKTDKTLFGEVFFNLYTKPKDKIVGELDYLIADNHDKLILPPNKKTMISDSIIFDKFTQLMILTSHNHRYGEKFDIYLVGGPDDGKLVYSSTDYVHPPILYMDKPMEFQKGQGMRFDITYNNTTSRTIEFGVTSEDEMGILFGYTIKN